MEYEYNIPAYMLKIKQKQNKIEKLKKKLEKYTNKQDILLEDIQTIIKQNDYQVKKQQLEDQYQKEFEKFNEFNEIQREILKKFAFISNQQELIEQIDAGYLQQRIQEEQMDMINQIETQDKKSEDEQTNTSDVFTESFESSENSNS